MAPPTDPLYADQWHLKMIGKLEKVWDEYTGVGIHVGVYDDGFNYTHEDLAPNYDASRHVVDASLNPIDPAPIDFTAGGDGHGTACAGIIGAANNGIGGVGVAYGVGLTGVNIDFSNTGLYGSINSPDYSSFVDVVNQAATRFDVTSNSWGANPTYSTGLSLLGNGFATAVNGAYANISANGRGGLGTVIAQAAGNEDSDANGAGLNASRYTITVSATESTGFAAWYSNFGANILVAAPAAAVTTDLTGSAGYDPSNYTTGFNGTSAATPVISGVVSLILDANSDLGWRDVHNILANSAMLTGSAFDATSGDIEEDGLWYTNANDNWNGGGNHVHTNYGYGMVNAYNAVRMAEAWSLFDTAKTSANEVTVTSGLNDFVDTVLPDATGSGAQTTFTIGGNVQIEHVALTLDFLAQDMGDLQVQLTSAEGTTVVVGLATTGLNFTRNGQWVYGIDSLRGELAAGTWTMAVYDLVSGDSTTVRSAKLDIYGSTASTDDVHHFTDEYSTMVGFNSGRGIISDTNGGTDWLDMAAVSKSVTLSLVSDESFSFDGTVVGALSGTIENIVTGDGNDVLTGSTGANEIHAMRGNDTLNGGGGIDVLVGGTGDDTYITDGEDTITEDDASGTDLVKSSASITLSANVENLLLTGLAAIDGTGNSLGNTITGNASGNLLDGAGGADTLIGGDGGDIYVTDGGDTITETSNDDVDVVRSSVTYVLGSKLEWLELTGSAVINGTGNAGENVIEGNSAANVLNGAGGSDIMTGGDGDDTYITDGGDTINEFSAQGNDLVLSSATITLSGHVENLTLTGSTAINGTGNDGGNIIFGNNAANIINGNGGADFMNGGGGDDTYITDGGDSIHEDMGKGTDTVRSSVNYTLGANVEKLVLTGTGALNGTGNGANNTLTGNSGKNTLNGAGGLDVMLGGAGDDTYVTNGGDSISEDKGKGTDTVLSSINYTLGANVEKLVLTGTGALNGTGNGANNTLTGNSGKNTLNGAGGLDIMLGGAGNDTYVTDGGDTITERLNKGIDTVKSSVDYTLGLNLEKLVLTGTAGIDGTGNGLGNTIVGNKASNELDGDIGKDTLTGGTGADHFVFDVALRASNVDKVTDFKAVDDTFDIDNAFFKGLTDGTLSEDAFAKNRTGNAGGEDVRIIYDFDSGKLYFDRDGSGSADKVLFATLGTKLGLGHEDFMVI